MTAHPALPPVLVSAYAASPAFRAWDPVLERDLHEQLFALDGVVGFEIPWLGRIHPHDDDWFLANVPEGSRLAFTALPRVMGQSAENPEFGIASADDQGRRAAMNELRAQRDDVKRINDAGRARVDLVALHTAPRLIGNGDSLAVTLAEIAEWDWDGAELVIEHCDAFVPGQAHEKGFLPLAAEVQAIADSEAPIGLWMNWGRSAIELRDADAVTAQLAEAAASGMLRGLAFSGASGDTTAYGTGWSDCHLPIRDTDPASGSMLEAIHVADAFAAVGTPPWLGVKVSRKPADTTAAEVAATVAENLALISSAVPSGGIVAADV